MNLFDKIKSVLSAKAPPTSAALFDLLTSARAALADAERRLAEAEAGRADAVLGGDAARNAARTSLAEARGDRDDAAAAVAAIEARHADALAAEAEADRRARYEAALALRDAAAKRVKTEYPKLAAALADLIKVVAEADREIELVNKTAPEAEALLSTEAIVRDEPYRPRKVVSQTTFDAWCSEGKDQPILDPSRVREIVVDPNDNSRGAYTYPAPVGWAYGDLNVDRYRRRRFRKTETMESFPGATGERLATMSLPPLKAHGRPYYTRPTSVSPSPLAVLDEFNIIGRWAPTDFVDDRRVDIRYELLDDAPAAAAAE